MKKIPLTFLILSILLMVGCGKTSQTPEEVILDANPKDTMTMEEARGMVEGYIVGMKEYNETNGYHLEQIDAIDAGCPDCFIFKYEYRMRDVEGDDLEISGVANVTITMFYGDIVTVSYWDDITNEEKGLEVQEEPLIGGQKDEYGCLGPAGYSWCEAKQKCLRTWEEACDE